MWGVKEIRGREGRDSREQGILAALFTHVLHKVADEFRVATPPSTYVSEAGQQIASPEGNGRHTYV